MPFFSIQGELAMAKQFYKTEITEMNSYQNNTCNWHSQLGRNQLPIFIIETIATSKEGSGHVCYLSIQSGVHLGINASGRKLNHALKRVTVDLQSLI
jgi:hypothetical protein